MTLTWHRPGHHARARTWTTYRSAGKLFLCFLYQAGESVLIRTLNHELRCIKEEKKESLKVAVPL